MPTYKNMDLKIGDFVIIITDVLEVYIGDVFATFPKGFILHKALRHDTIQPLKYPTTFHEDEVMSVVKIRKDDTDPPVSLEVKSVLTKAEFKKIINIALNYKFIWNRNEKLYEEAISTLKESEFIGISGYGTNILKGPLELIICSTLHEVFIFDVNYLTDIDSLLQVLNMRYLKKIIYDGGLFYDSLYDYYKTQLRNFVDVQILDFVSKNDDSSTTNRSFPEILNKNLGLPYSIIHDDDELREKVWNSERPFVKSDLIRAAELVVYLPILYKRFVKIHNETHDRSLSLVVEQIKHKNL